MSEDKPDNVIKIDFGGGAYPGLGTLAQELFDLVFEYDGELPLVSVLGVLDVVKFQLIQSHFEE